MLDRRGFLKLLGGGGLAAVAASLGLPEAELDIDRLLWVPGSKTLFVPDNAIVQAYTIEEAAAASVSAVWLNKQGRPVRHLDLILGKMPGITIEQRLAEEIASIERSGGQVVASRKRCPKERIMIGSWRSIELLLIDGHWRHRVSSAAEP